MESSNPLQFHARLENLPSITVKSPGAYRHIGDFRTERIVDEARDVLDKHLAADIPAVLDALRAFLDKCPKLPAVWFTIRITTRGHHFDTPRWHRDGRMWSVDGVARKFAVTLTGPPTRLLDETPIVTAAMEPCNYESRREILADLLANEPLIPVETGDVISFSCGESNSPVHSEPAMITDRVFVSAVPGEISQIKSLADIRNSAYTTFNW